MGIIRRKSEERVPEQIQNGCSTIYSIEELAGLRETSTNESLAVAAARNILRLTITQSYNLTQDMLKQ